MLASSTALIIWFIATPACPQRVSRKYIGLWKPKSVTPRLVKKICLYLALLCLRWKKASTIVLLKRRPTRHASRKDDSMTDAFLTVLAIGGGVSLALVLAGLVSDGLLPWLERKFQK